MVPGKIVRIIEKIKLMLILARVGPDTGYPANRLYRISSIFIYLVVVTKLTS